MPVAIRAATLGDCAAMALVRVRSIRMLCAPDHHNDEAAIASWAGDGSPDKFIRILSMPDAVVLVAERAGQIVAVGALAGDRVTLNYVDPDHRFQGVSKAMMAALEQSLRDAGVRTAHLDSSATALPFYRSLGWVDGAETVRGYSVDGYPMSKVL